MRTAIWLGVGFGIVFLINYAVYDIPAIPSVRRPGRTQ